MPCQIKIRKFTSLFDLKFLPLILKLVNVSAVNTFLKSNKYKGLISDFD